MIVDFKFGPICNSGHSHFPRRNLDSAMMK